MFGELGCFVVFGVGVTLGDGTADDLKYLGLEHYQIAADPQRVCSDRGQFFRIVLTSESACPRRNCSSPPSLTAEGRVDNDEIRGARRIITAKRRMFLMFINEDPTESTRPDFRYFGLLQCRWRVIVVYKCAAVAIANSKPLIFVSFFITVHPNYPFHCSLDLVSVSIFVCLSHVESTYGFIPKAYSVRFAYR